MKERKMTRYMVAGTKMTKVKIRNEAKRLNLSAWPKESWREFAKRVGKHLLAEVNVEIDNKINAGTFSPAAEMHQPQLPL